MFKVVATYLLISMVIKKIIWFCLRWLCPVAYQKFATRNMSHASAFVQASFVLCRVFIKSHHRNNLSGHVNSFNGEETIATVPHVGIQFDGSAALATGSKMHDENTIDQENDVSKLPSGLVTDLNGHAVTENVAKQVYRKESFVLLLCKGA